MGEDYDGDRSDSRLPSDIEHRAFSFYWAIKMSATSPKRVSTVE